MRCDCNIGDLTVSYDSPCPQRTSSVHLYSSQAKSWNKTTSAQLTETMRLYNADGFTNVLFTMKCQWIQDSIQMVKKNQDLEKIKSEKPFNTAIKCNLLIWFYYEFILLVNHNDSYKWTKAIELLHAEQVL